MRSFSARDAAKNFGEVLDAAESGAVAVLRHDRPRVAVIGWRLYLDYKKAHDDALRARQIDFLEVSVKALSEGKLGTGARARALAARLGTPITPAPETPPAEEKAGA